MLSVCICDDDPTDVAHIQDLAGGFARKYPEYPMKVRQFTSAFDLLEQLQRDGGFDLYLLDILMPHFKGLELAEKIRARNETAEILFLTSSPEYALDAFEVAACGYLLKPVEQEKFDRALLAAAQRLIQPQNPYLLLKTREGMRRILFRELVMVESFNHERVCTLSDGSRASTTDTLTAIMNRLSGDARFFSPHRAYIINLEHISELRASDVLLSTGQRVPVARTCAVALKKAYVNYLF